MLVHERARRTTMLLVAVMMVAALGVAAIGESEQTGATPTDPGEPVSYDVYSEKADGTIDLKSTSTSEYTWVDENYFSGKSSPVSWGSGTYLIVGNVDFSSYNYIEIAGTVNIILGNGATFTTGILSLQSGATLNICQETGTTNPGKLVVDQRAFLEEDAPAEMRDHPAIGGDGYSSINIHGGVVEATSESRGATIGSSMYGSGGEINIYNGTVSAANASEAEIEEDITGAGAAIGSGGGATGAAVVNIYNGTVTATASGDGAAIGSGVAAGTITVTITGCDSITATASGYGAAIGSGYGAGEATVNISGGDSVTATASSSGAAIGSGSEAEGAVTVNISGGNVTASTELEVEESGAAIGSGTATTGEVTVTITGGVVVATSGGGGAAIGSGNESEGAVTVDIRGDSKVTATNPLTEEEDYYYAGAAIGSGFSATGKVTVKIGGSSDVTASAGNSSAAIGSGYEAGEAEVIISGGKVTASNSSTVSPGAAIGSGYDVGSAIVKITGGSVLATNADGPSIGGFESSVTIEGGQVKATNIGTDGDGTVTISTGRLSHEDEIIVEEIEDTNSENWSGVVFVVDDVENPADGQGTVYGEVEADSGYKFYSGFDLTVPADTTLHLKGGLELDDSTITNRGSITGNPGQEISGSGDIDNYGTVPEGLEFSGDIAKGPEPTASIVISKQEDGGYLITATITVPGYNFPSEYTHFKEHLTIKVGETPLGINDFEVGFSGVGNDTITLTRTTGNMGIGHVTATLSIDDYDSRFWAFEAVYDSIDVGTVTIVDESGDAVNETLVGETLTAKTEDTPDGVGLEYQWYRGDEPIDDATNINYQTTADDVGSEIRVVVTSSDTQYPGTIESGAVSVDKADQTLVPIEGTDYYIDYVEETITALNATGECELATSSEATIGSESLVLNPFDSTYQVYIRLAETDTHNASEWVAITIPVRPAAPSEDMFEVDYGDETLSIPGGFSYNTNSSDYADPSWTDSSGTEVGGYVDGETVYVYQNASQDDKKFKSSVQTLTADDRSAEAPTVTIDYVAETVSTDKTMEYSSDDGQTWDVCGDGMSAFAFGNDGTSPITVQFRYAATDSSYASGPYTLEIPARPDPAEYLEFSHEGEDRGTVAVPTGYSYNTNSESYNDLRWTAGDGSEVSIEHGTTLYYYQNAIEGQQFKSKVLSISPASHTDAPNVVIDYIGETVSTTTHMQYSTDGGETWTTCGGNMSAFAFGNDGTSQVTVQFRYTPVGDTSGAVQSLTIPARPAAPEIQIDMVNQCIDLGPDYRYNTASGGYDDAGWSDGKAGIPLPEDSTVYVYQKAIEDRQFKSFVKAVPAPSAPGAPSVSIDYVNETVSTDLTMEYSLDDGRNWSKCDANMSAFAFGNMEGTTPVTVQFRYASDGYAGAVQSLTIPARPAAPNLEPEHNDAGYDTVAVPVGHSYNTSSGSYDSDGWTGGSGSDVRVPSTNTMYVYKDAVPDVSFKSHVQTITASPHDQPTNVVIDYIGETVSTTTHMQYSTDGGETWTTCGGNMSALAFGNPDGNRDATVLFRYIPDDTDHPGPAQTLTIPARPSAPSLALDYENERVLIPAGHSYNTHTDDPYDGRWVSEAGYVSVPANGTISIMEDAVRGQSFRSHVQTIEAPDAPAAPDVRIDYVKETVSTTSDMEYSVDGGRSWVQCDDDMYALGFATREWHSATVLFRYASDGYPGEEQTLTIPARPSAPTLELEHNHVGDVFTDTVYVPRGHTYNQTSPDYGADGWTAGRGTDVTIANDNLYVYQDAVQNRSFKSFVQTIHPVSHDSMPEVAVDFLRETVSTTDHMQYSTDGGATWTQCGDDMSAFAFGNDDGDAEVTVLFRYIPDDPEHPGEQQTLTIPARPAAPEVAIDYENETVGIPEGHSYNYFTGDPADGRWVGEAGDVVVPAGWTVYVCKDAVEGQSFRSDVVHVTAPAQHDRPNVGIDYIDETLTGIEGDRPIEYSVNGEDWLPCHSDMSVLEITDLTVHNQQVLFRYAAGPGGYASDPQTLVIPERPAAPDEITCEVSGDTVTVYVTGSLEGYVLEYSMDGGLTWQESNVFTGLAGDTEYQLQIRVKADQIDYYDGNFHSLDSTYEVTVEGSGTFWPLIPVDRPDHDVPIPFPDREQVTPVDDEDPLIIPFAVGAILALLVMVLFWMDRRRSA